MKGYPRHKNTKQDFLNLLSDSRYKEHAIQDLQGIYDLQDDEVEIDDGPVDENDESQGRKTTLIKNPSPAYRRLGFESREEIQDLIHQSSEA